MAVINNNLTVAISAGIQKSMSTMAMDFGSALIHELSAIYGFDAEEAAQAVKLAEISVTKTKAKSKAIKPTTTAIKVNKPSIPIPFVGTVDDTRCHAIRLDHGLHTQCWNNKMDSGDYCTTCQKHADKNTSGKPNYGDIRDRLTCGLLEFRDPKGKRTVSYGNVIEKLGISKQAAIDEATKFGIQIPDELWEVVKAKRGRPKKDVSVVSDTESEASEPKKRRGRPKKAKTVTHDADDLLAALSSAAKDAKKADDASSVVSSTSSKRSRGRPALTAEQKEERRLAKEAAKQAKKADKEAEKEAKKAAKLAEKEAKKAAKLAEKEAKKAQKVELVEDDDINSDSDVEGIIPKTTPTPPKDDTPCDHTNDDDDDEDEVNVTPFTFDGRQFFKTADNQVFNKQGEHIAEYDPVHDELIPVTEVDSDEEED